MATLYIEYYGGTIEAGEAQVPENLRGTDKLTVGVTSARTSSDIPSGTKFLVLKTDVACQYALGDSSVTADANSQFLAANGIWGQGIDGNERIAVIEQQ